MCTTVKSDLSKRICNLQLSEIDKLMFHVEDIFLGLQLQYQRQGNQIMSEKDSGCLSECLMIAPCLDIQTYMENMDTVQHADTDTTV